MIRKQADTAQRSPSMSRRLSTRFGTEDYFFKIKNRFPTNLYVVIRSYLLHRRFQSQIWRGGYIKEINLGVPQDSVLEPMLYSLYTADLPVALGFIT